MTSKAKITIVVDNMPGKGLKNSWGFSALVEADNWSILFDADTDPSVIEYNIKKLNIDLNKISFAILSHHHGDHYGGFKYIGKIRPNLKVYIPPGSAEYLIRWGLKPQKVEKPLKLFDDAWLTGSLKSWKWGISEHAFSFYIENKGLIVLVGCSHPGADKLAAKAREISGYNVYWVVGGYHSPSYNVLDKLAEFSAYISPAHCSGDAAREYVKTKYPKKYVEVRTGTIVNL